MRLTGSNPDWKVYQEGFHPKAKEVDSSVIQSPVQPINICSMLIRLN